MGWCHAREAGIPPRLRRDPFLRKEVTSSAPAAPALRARSLRSPFLQKRVPLCFPLPQEGGLRGMAFAHVLKVKMP